MVERSRRWKHLSISLKFVAGRATNDIHLFLCSGNAVNFNSCPAISVLSPLQLAADKKFFSRDLL